ncbi:MAG: type IV pilus secretin PilQ [Mariprofundaceae bacterium]
MATIMLPALAEASQINSVALMDSESGDVVRIEADSALEYQIFDLDGPPRMVLNFPGASISSDVGSMQPDGSGVTSVFPVKSEDGVRIEIGLSEMIGYKVEDNGNALIIRFSQPNAEDDQSATAAKLKDIEVRDRGSVTELVLRGENMDASHNAFLTNKDHTLILDFWGASSVLPKEFYQYSTQRIRNVTVGEAEGRVRLVIGLIPGGDMNRQMDADSGQLVVRFGNVSPKRRSAAVVVESVDFQPDDRIAHIVVRTDVVNPVVNINEKDGSVIINLKKAQLASGQERSQDVRAFPGPINQIDSYTIGDDIRIVARLRDKVNVTTFQQGNLFTINLEPQDLYLARSGSGTEDAFAYSGQKVTFDFKDIDIRNALKLISEMSDLNIIMADDVSGKLTMRLVDVPWDQALDLILTARGLGQEKTGNVMRIAPVEVLRAEYESKLQARRGSEQLEPLVTEFITLSFTKVADVKTMLEGASANATKGGAKSAPEATSASSSSETSVGILSPRGSFLVDERTNTLIIKDTQAAINSVKRLIATIDKPVKQVLIESRIVEAKDTFQREFGIRWGGKFSDSNTGVGFPNAVSVQGAGAGTSVGNSTTLVDLPAAFGAALGSGGALGLSLGSVASAINLDLELSASEADGDTKIISNPRVVTTNLKPAFIKQGIQIPFVTPGTANSPPTTTLIEALLELQVTPQITANNGVILDVIVKKNSPDANSGGIDTKEINTNIYMRNGETVVIGGVYERTTSDITGGVPLLSKIPVLGWLFKKNEVVDDKSELLIFLTPKILNTVGK